MSTFGSSDSERLPTRHFNHVEGTHLRCRYLELYKFAFSVETHVVLVRALYDMFMLSPLDVAIQLSLAETLTYLLKFANEITCQIVLHDTVFVVTIQWDRYQQMRKTLHSIKNILHRFYCTISISSDSFSISQKRVSLAHWLDCVALAPIV